MSGMTLFDYVRSSGIIGVLVIVATLALLAFGLTGLVSHGRGSPATLLALALLPVGLGALGTLWGTSEVYRRIALAGGAATPHEVARGLALAKTPLVMGAIGGALVASLALVGFFVPSGGGGDGSERGGGDDR